MIWFLFNYLFLGLEFLFPCGINGVHHPLYREVRDGAKYCKAEEEADNLIATQRAGDIVCWNLLQHHHHISACEVI